MLAVEYTQRFKRDAKRLRRREFDLSRLGAAITLLRKRGELPDSLRGHALVGNYSGHRECHVAPDWLLIYRVDDEALLLTAVRTESHGNLLGL